MDAVLYLRDRDHVLVGKENGVIGTSNLLEMVPGVLEGQTSGDLFLNSIFDPSVIGANAKLLKPVATGHMPENLMKKMHSP